MVLRLSTPIVVYNVDNRDIHQSYPYAIRKTANCNDAGSLFSPLICDVGGGRVWKFSLKLLPIETTYRNWAS